MTGWRNLVNEPARLFWVLRRLIPVGDAIWWTIPLRCPPKL